MSAARREGLRVVLTGTECTGKTTLAAHLAARLDTSWAPEAARAHARQRGGLLSADDVEPIARAHVAGEEAAWRAARGGLLVLDTDLVSTCVYARHYYGHCPQWIERAARERRGDLYLLLAPGLPWVADGVRDRPDLAERLRLHAAFQRTLGEIDAQVELVDGSWEERQRAAWAALERWRPAGLAAPR